ncbi:MAG: SGNH/GDSL hydrolase family protein [Eubacteriales bacterium]|nr:SGNH/GDSL hydrolase family protein [Eubacteriales bacterium]
MNEWFEKYFSNTSAGSGNQHAFRAQEGKEYTSRVYYKVFAGGEYGYSFLYSNVLDSTFADGSLSNCNMLCEPWRILSASVGVCAQCGPDDPAQPRDVQRLTFAGSEQKQAAPGEFFATDEVRIRAEAGEYLCVEMRFCGSLIPCHPESIIPAFLLEEGQWTPSQQLPFASMVGCDRPVRARVGFMGDSITQGIGTPNNSYAHWMALCAQEIGGEYGWWDLGLGYARAYDASSNGAWLYKGKQCDFAVVCYGTNDVAVGRTPRQIADDLRRIVDKLHEAGVKVLLQSLPPFDWTGENLEKWLETNRIVRGELACAAEAFFDVVPVLTDDEQGGACLYGSHPDETGCAKWAEALTPVLRAFLQEQA